MWTANDHHRRLPLGRQGKDKAMAFLTEPLRKICLDLKVLMASARFDDWGYHERQQVWQAFIDLSTLGQNEEELERIALHTGAIMHDRETDAVRALGNRIGYGRLMQLAEDIWHEKARADNIPGSELTVGTAGAFLVPCPHPEPDANGHCAWCCGVGRITQRVRQAQGEQ
jgi:hypothetical protein